MHLPAAIRIREVGLRDGLQSLARTLPTAHKLEWICDARAAGLREIEVGWREGEAFHGSIARAELPKTMAAS